MSKGIRRMFADVSPTYELANHGMTFGLDHVWRYAAARIASKVGGKKWLDLCSGTGDMARLLHQVSPDDVNIVALDFSLPMLRHAKSESNTTQVDFTLADARTLPFSDESFDLVTISFATRNLNTTQQNLIEVLREISRIAKPGGVLLILETSQPRSTIIRLLFHWYVRNYAKRMGTLISGSRSGYNYLAHTVTHFYDAKELGIMLFDAGFSEVKISLMFFGIVAIHLAKK